MSTTRRLMAAGTASLLAALVSSAALGQVQDKNQQKCIEAINKDAAKVAATQGKLSSGCVKTGTKGAVTANCPTTDPKLKLQKAEAKTTADNGKDCVLTPPDPPSFGYTSDTIANTAAVSNELDLLADTYGGTDLSAVISTDKTIGKCQAAVTKDVEKVAANVQKDYVGCKKNALKAGAANGLALQPCVNQDAKQKTHAAIVKLQGDVMKDCTGVTQSSAFPGVCSSAADLGACLGTKAICEMCEAINAEDGLFANCDKADDGILNGSCSVTCPLAAGRYTQTTTGGSLHAATFAVYAFPTGGVTIQDVSAGDSSCVHTSVVPFPNGLTVPPFCVPALGATASVIQSGCGIGKIASDGGADFTINENGDTSETTICSAHQASCPGAGPAPDSSGRIDITVGDGTTDVCSGGGSINALVSIPVNTTTWVAADSSCPDGDGTFDPGTDTLLAQFPQTLDLTTDTNIAQFVDIDGDGCSKSGLGPNAFNTPPANGPNSTCLGAGDPMACCTGLNTGTCVGPTGSCLNTSTMAVSMAGSGTIFSSGGPTYDLLFATVQNSTVSGPVAHTPATCGSPPVINFSGAITRCLNGP